MGKIENVRPALLLTAGTESKPVRRSTMSDHTSDLPQAQLPLFDPIEIRLTRGQVALIDPVDSDLAALKWCALKSRLGFYAVRQSYYLHRAIMERILGRSLAQGEEVDHINGNKLDNRRDNLRIATPTQNRWNSPRRSDNRSGFKGVCWHKQRQAWRATFGIKRKYIHLGYFDTPEEAHAAYLAAARQYAGEFTRDK
jgi:hypothetical protein